MKPILIFRHIACEGPGYLGDFLDRRDIPYRVIPVDDGAAVPSWPVAAAGLVFMGGSMSVNDPLDWIARELDLIRNACLQGMPVLGHCLGAQLIARALGGMVVGNPVKEIGWHDIECMDAPGFTGLLSRLPRRFEGFHWHGETFTLPPGAALIMKSRHCAHQAFIHGSALALQFHVEITAEMVREWTRLSHDELERDGGQGAVQTPAQMLGAIDGRTTELHRIADVLYDFWLKGG